MFTCQRDSGLSSVECVCAGFCHFYVPSFFKMIFIAKYVHVSVGFTCYAVLFFYQIGS